jgi:sigma-B regulation protein RsbU (phosphoserine phosphatase)
MRLKSLSTRLIAWVLGATLTVSTVTFYAEFVENRQKLKEDASKTAEFAARALANDISALIRGIEQATRTLGSVVRHVRPDPDQTRALLHSLIEADEAIYGAAIAYAPEAFIAGTDFAAYMHRTQDGMRYLDIVSQDPGFRNDPWYRVPSLTGKASWSEPYLDVKLGAVDMVTFSIPVFEDLESGPRLLAVVSADVALQSQRARIDAKSRELGEDIRVLILSRGGRVITVDALDSELTRDTSGVYTLPLADHAAQRGREDIRVLAKRMTQGEQGTTTLVGLNRETRQWIHFRPLARTGWSVAIIVEEAELLTEIQESEFREVVIFSLYVLLMVLVVVVLARRITGPLRQLAGAAREIGHDPLAAKVPAIQTEDEVADLGEALRRMQVDLIQYVDELKSTMDAKQRLEGELAAAQQIQMAMLPNLPTHGRLIDGCDVAATLIPAKAVGGDLTCPTRGPRPPCSWPRPSPWSTCSAASRSHRANCSRGSTRNCVARTRPACSSRQSAASSTRPAAGWSSPMRATIHRCSAAPITWPATPTCRLAPHWGSSRRSATARHTWNWARASSCSSTPTGSPKRSITNSSCLARHGSRACRCNCSTPHERSLRAW